MPKESLPDTLMSWFAKNTNTDGEIPGAETGIAESCAVTTGYTAPPPDSGNDNGNADGEPCEINMDCNSGLVCYQNKCTICTDKNIPCNNGLIRNPDTCTCEPSSGGDDEELDDEGCNDTGCDINNDGNIGAHEDWENLCLDMPKVGSKNFAYVYNTNPQSGYVRFDEFYQKYPRAPLDETCLIESFGAAGESCDSNSDCNSGLSCYQNKCISCTYMSVACLDGKIRNPDTCQCEIPDCPTGLRWSTEDKDCITNTCTGNLVWNDSKQDCVPCTFGYLPNEDNSECDWVTCNANQTPDLTDGSCHNISCPSGGKIFGIGGNTNIKNCCPTGITDYWGNCCLQAAEYSKGAPGESYAYRQVCVSTPGITVIEVPIPAGVDIYEGDIYCVGGTYAKPTSGTFNIANPGTCTGGRFIRRTGFGYMGGPTSYFELRNGTKCVMNTSTERFEPFSECGIDMHYQEGKVKMIIDY
jgi:hypothetical protein